MNVRRGRWWPLLLGLLPLGCGGAGVGPGAVPSPTWHTYPEGIGATLGLAATEEFLADTVTAASDRARLAADGFHWVRFDLTWERVEPEPGTWAFASYDRVVSDLVTVGFEPIGLLLYGHPAYLTPEERARCRSIDAGEKCISTDLGPFLRYVRTVVSRYRDRIRYWEVWNEANAWYRFWPARAGADPDLYARMLTSVAAIVAELCPTCSVLMGGLVYLEYPPVVEGQLDFMRRMLAAVPGLFARLDGLGFHHYTRYPPVAPPESADWGEVPLAEMLDATRQVCACTTPIWITETGWPTSRTLSQEQQARFALRGWLIALTRGVRSWIWWSLRELDRPVLAPPEAHFGLWSVDGEPKPAYTAIVRLRHELGDAVAVADVRARYGPVSGSLWAVALELSDGREAEVLWSMGGPPAGDLARWEARFAGHRGLDLVTGVEVAAWPPGPNPVLVRE